MNKTEIVMVLDKSGSMAGLTSDTIGSYNKFIKDQQENNPDAYITTVLFSDTPVFFQRRVKIKEAKLLDKETYNPNGSTALHDAIGQALLGLQFLMPKKAVIAILTDGEENSSTTFNLASTKCLIEAAQKRDWAVLFLAANQNAFHAGNQMGVNARTISNFATSSLGASNAINTVSSYAVNYSNDVAQASLQSMYDSNLKKAGA